MIWAPMCIDLPFLCAQNITGKHIDTKESDHTSFPSWKIFV